MRFCDTHIFSSFKYLQCARDCVGVWGGGRGREETSLSVSLSSKIYHNLTLTYRYSSDDFFTLNGANGVIKYLAVRSGPARGSKQRWPQDKLLGVIIDNSLSFKAHIKEICRKVNTKVSILRRIRKFIPSDIMIKLYKTTLIKSTKH